MAFQIGYQPLIRCHYQNGYMYPMKKCCPLQDDMKFEKIRFPQSASLSKKIFNMTDEGKKVFPHEGISDAYRVLDKIKQSTTFSLEDLQHTLNENTYSMYKTVDQLAKALKAVGVTIQDSPVVYSMSKEQVELINRQYDCVDFVAAMGGMVFSKPDQYERRKAICRNIYGKEI